MATRLPPDTPDEVRVLIAPYLEPDHKGLDAIGSAIAAKRSEAVKARLESGIELTWIAAEEAYIGIDDANRSEVNAAGGYTKSMSRDGPLTSNAGPKTDANKHSSTAFVRLTARYVDAGAAKLGEILLPLDDKAFSITETPVPELIKGKDDEREVLLDDGAPAMRAPMPNEMPNPAGPALPQPPGVAPAAVGAPAGGGAVPPAAGAVAPEVPIKVKDLAKEKIARAREKAKRAEEIIFDWMIESQFPAEARKAIFDGARIGVGVLKGPFSKATRHVVAKGDGKGLEIMVRDDVKPGVRCVDPWNVFPDPACGEVIANGSYCFERDFLSERQVRDLKKVPNYIKRQVDKVLLEGPKTSTEATHRKPGETEEQKRHQFEVWYFTGTLSRADMECIYQAIGKPLTNKDMPEGATEAFAIVTMINDTVIRASFNPLDSGAINYHNCPWQRRSGYWAGIGIGEQVVTPQRMVNAATRAMLNNAGKSAGSQIIVNRDAVVPADGDWTMVPDKFWWLSGDETSQTVEQAFGLFQIPNVTPQLMTIVQYALRLAEESTSIPLITQGQSGPTQPQTFGAAQLQNNNANQLLRSIGYNWDDFITEPLVRQFYEWLLLDPNVPTDAKGDFSINAHGSAALVERAIQDDILAQLLPLSLQPAYKLDPAMTMAELLKAKRFDPRNFKRSDEEQEQVDAQPPPKAPQVQAAEIRAASDKEKTAVVEANKKDIATAELQVEVMDINKRHELAMLEYANARGISVQDAKVELATTAMQLETQRELAGKDREAQQQDGGGGQVRPQRRVRPQRSRPAPQVATAAIEPAGRAPNGQAFQQ